MKKEVVIELDEKELAKILAKHFNVEEESARVDVYKFNGGDQREPSYTKITFKAPLKTK